MSNTNNFGDSVGFFVRNADGENSLTVHDGDDLEFEFMCLGPDNFRVERDKRDDAETVHPMQKYSTKAKKLRVILASGGSYSAGLYKRRT